jgi:N-acetylneuraminic acid mutarotase
MFFIGWLGLLLFHVWRSLLEFREARRIWRNSELITDPVMLQHASSLGAAMGLFSIPLLRESALASSPLLLGAPGPTIIFPSDDLKRFSEKELRMALAHELAHVRRRDLWMGLFPGLAKMLLGFHPLVYLAHGQWARAVEEACDADAIRWSSTSAEEYGGFLLRLATRKQPRVGIVLEASGAYRHLDRRLAALRYACSTSTLLSVTYALFLILIAATLLPWVPGESLKKHARVLDPKPTSNTVSAIPRSHGHEEVRRDSVSVNLNRIDGGAVSTNTDRPKSISGLATGLFRSFFNVDPLESEHLTATHQSNRRSADDKSLALKQTIPRRPRLGFRPRTASDFSTRATPTDSAQGWSTATPMLTPRNSVATAVVDGQIFVFGGYNRDILNVTEVFDPSTNNWSTRHPMPTARENAGAAVGKDGKIYVIGGFINGVVENGTAVNVVEAFDPHTNLWCATAPMPTARAIAGVTTGKDGRIYVIGGASEGPDKGPLHTVEAFDPRTNTWSKCAPMPTARMLGDAVTTGPDGRIYAIGGGGSGGVVYSTVEAYDPLTNSWTTLPPMPNALGSSVATGPDGKIYAVGGFTDGGRNVVDTVEVFDPRNGNWSYGPPMPTARGSAGVEAGPDGRIYAIGGCIRAGLIQLDIVEALAIPEPEMAVN